MKVKSILFWGLRIVVAIILLQTLYFKFGAQPESVYIFTTVGMEPWGRIGSGIVELVATMLLLIPRTTAFGALLALSTMSGAIFFHLTKLGIEIMGDNGTLFYLALIVFISSLILLVSYRQQVLNLVVKK